MFPSPEFNLDFVPYLHKQTSAWAIIVQKKTSVQFAMIIHGYESKDIRKRVHTSQKKKHTRYIIIRTFKQ